MFEYEPFFRVFQAGPEGMPWPDPGPRMAVRPPAI